MKVGRSTRMPLRPLASTPDRRCTELPPRTLLVPGLARTAVTRDGLVYSWRRSAGWVLRTPHVHPDGHTQVMIDGHGPREVGELVALSYVGPRPSRRHALHYADGNPTNAVAKNLSWETLMRRIPRRKPEPTRNAIAKTLVSGRAETRAPWTDDEDVVIATFWSANRASRRHLIHRLRRSEKAIICRASKLRIAVNSWSFEETHTLRENYGVLSRRGLLGLRPHRSWGAIASKAKKLGHVGMPQGFVALGTAAKLLGVGPKSLERMSRFRVTWHERVGRARSPKAVHRIALVDEVADAFAVWSTRRSELKGAKLAAERVRIASASVTALTERKPRRMTRAERAKRDASIPRHACPKCGRPTGLVLDVLLARHRAPGKERICDGSLKRVEGAG